MDVKPIPAFYCCYLLRSTIRHASLYVGSSPHPARRLAQHNGKVKGGAVRTSRLSLRPWEMTCIVAGFPSNIAALQFEWAWHNAHLTRHITPDERLSFATARTKTSSRTGKTTKRPGRPRTSLIDKLSNLHLLLRVPYFSKWPLELRFFSEDVFGAWQTWCDRVDTQIRSGIKVILDLPRAEPAEAEFTSAQPPKKRRKIDLIGTGGVDGVDPTYANLQNVLEKSKFILDDDEELTCDVCNQSLERSRQLFTICPHDHCQSLSHVACLSKKFLREASEPECLPERGICPSCKADLVWAELMREVSLRARGDKEVQKLLSKKRRTKVVAAAEILDSESEAEDEEEEAEALTAAEIAEEDAEDGEDDDAISIASVDSFSTLGSKFSPAARGHTKSRPLEIVIEDSDEDMPRFVW